MEVKQAVETGSTSATNSKQVAALIEAMFAELYSILDCIRSVLHTVYGNLRGITSKSTYRLFHNANKGLFDERIPGGIQDELAKAYGNWFHELRDIRRTLTHSSTGFCWKDEDDGQIYYVQPALVFDGKPYVKKKVFEYISRLEQQIISLQEIIFAELNNTLVDSPVQVLCGIYKGRGYIRSVSLSAAKDFNSGYCLSYKWFEQDNNPTCPMAEKCGAYKNKQTK